VAFVALEAAILGHDFSIEYVAQNTSRSTPFVFLLASAWAALEGSIVLWALILAGFVWWVGRRVDDGDKLGIGALAVLGLTVVFWFGLMATASNPFQVCTEAFAGGVGCSTSSWFPLAAAEAPLDGFGPNALLQNHILMAVHPPMLYIGYVGFSVPFAFAISAMAQSLQGSAWLERTHRWTIVAWAFLTLGIALGAWWSYEVLGWGGYWAWDPVENAAFLPWLIATAFIHSAVVQRRRGVLQAWNLILVISTFALTILGTFLTRSGTIISVHSFTQSAVGPVLLAFLGVILFGSFGLFALRSHRIVSSARLDSLASREGVFLANNLILTLYGFTVLVGTMYPLLLEAFAGRQVSVGRPFFDRVTLPVAFALLLAMGVGPVTPYRMARGSVVWQRIALPIQVGLAAGLFTAIIGVRSVPVVVIVMLATFAIAVPVRHFAAQVRTVVVRGSSVPSAMRAVLRREPGYWGGQISHIGVALVAIAIATTTALALRAEVTVTQGDAVRVGEYCVGYVGPFNRVEPNRAVDGAEMILMRDDCSTEIARMFPRVNRYTGSNQPVATPDVRTGLVDDVYLSLNGARGDQIFLDVLVFPFMWLLWAGSAVTVLGGFWSYVGGWSRGRDQSVVRTSEGTAA
jgi:cytochrome c-type biogenesis protein CcmF